MLIAGEPLKKVADITDGLRKDLANVPQQNLSGIQNISFIFNKNVSSVDVERHGEKVETIGLYKLKFATDEKLLVVYFSNNSLVTDEDVVDEY